MSADGHVAFDMPASNLVNGDTNGVEDVFVRGAPFELTSYTYDGLSRLLGADGWSAVRSYAYDPVGNRLELDRDGTPTAYTYDAADRLLSIGGTTVTVDAAGNLTARGADAFTYDAANRLVSASMNGVTQTSTYDGDGTRVATTIDSTTTSYVHDVAAGLPRVVDDGTRRYVWGAAGLAYAVEIASGSVEVVHADHLGSVRTMTDAAGTVVTTTRYDEFGVPLETTGAPGSPFAFTGEPTDPTGLVHLRARNYDPELGRFLNRDPWRGVAPMPATLNRYAYVANNPLRYVDPSGQCGIDLVIDALFIVLGIGAVIIGSDKERGENLGNLGMDAAGVLVPCGGGWTIRGAKTILGGAELVIDARQLQKKFKHAPDFGVHGNWNTENAEAFARAVQEHVARTDPVTGTLNRQSGTWYFDPQTGVGAFFNDANEFVTGFRLTPGQIGHFPNVGGH